jgi:hypothetical protein
VSNLLYEEFVHMARDVYGSDLDEFARDVPDFTEGGLVQAWGMAERIRFITRHMIGCMIEGNTERKPAPQLVRYPLVDGPDEARQMHRALLLLSNRADNMDPFTGDSGFFAASLVCALVWQTVENPNDRIDPAQVAAMYFLAAGKPPLRDICILLDRLREDQK